MTDPSPDLLFGQHPKIACLSSSGQKRYIYIRRTSRRTLFWKAPKGKLAKQAQIASFGQTPSPKLITSGPVSVP